MDGQIDDKDLKFIDFIWYTKCIPGRAEMANCGRLFQNKVNNYKSYKIDPGLRNQ
jgi:hypothetical protein